MSIENETKERLKKRPTQQIYSKKYSHKIVEAIPNWGPMVHKHLSQGQILELVGKLMKLERAYIGGT